MNVEEGMQSVSGFLRYFFRVKNECRGLLGDEGDGQGGAMR